MTPNPTTLNPITDPPVKATCRALAKPSCAALVVLLFAFVATFIPKNPAKPEAKAPTKNDTDINNESPVLFAAKANNIATITTKIDNTQYLNKQLHEYLLCARSSAKRRTAVRLTSR